MWRRLREDRDVIFGWFHVSNFLADVLSIFIFALWFWLLIIIFGDLLRRHDISGWAKAIWVIALIIFPYQGIFIDLITHHRGNGLNSANENYPGCLSKRAVRRARARRGLAVAKAYGIRSRFGEVFCTGASH